MNHAEKGVTVGRVVGLWRYPVKSMGAEVLTGAQVSWYGLTGDRRWAFVRAGVEQSGFPWLTIRQREDMGHYQPFFVDPDQPDKSKTRVRTPSGAEYDVTDPALSADLYKGEAQVIRQNRGVFDAFPLSMITVQTINRLSEEVGEELDVLRFRPNILVDASSNRPFIEDEWVGRVLTVGSMRMRVDKRDGRCVIITINPETVERNPVILRKVVEEREGCLGVYGSVVEPGRVAVNNSVLSTIP